MSHRITAPGLLTAATLAVLALGGCGTPGTITRAQPAVTTTAPNALPKAPPSSTATATATATNTTPSAEQVAEAKAIAKSKGGRDPRAGTDPRVVKAQPKLRLNATLARISDARQGEAAAWLNGFLVRSTFNLASLGPKKDPNAYRADMAPEAHRDYARAVKAGKGTWGSVMPTEWERFMRVEPIRNYTMASVDGWQLTRDSPKGVKFLVTFDQPLSTYAGAPGAVVDRAGYWHHEVLIGVVPGGPNGWQMAYWNTRAYAWVDQ